MITGIDVGYPQGHYLNWEQFIGDFAIIRNGGAGYEDWTYKRNKLAVLANRILHWDYYFLKGNENPTDAAKRSVDFMYKYGDPGARVFSPDIEDSGLNASKVYQYCYALRKLLPDWKILVYTSAYKWHSIVGRGKISWVKSLNLDLWTAHYTERPAPYLPDAWDDYTLWQKSAKFRMPGCYHSDLDYDVLSPVVDLPIYTGSVSAPELSIEDKVARLWSWATLQGMQ